ncbi:Threonine/homoserine/homoserine lactone efflux protein [Pseudomonas delhiensis]|uniref:Threonine/homoserine/homoserine lactone efflux protein n=1 Tax=Pseudomonas delhiensis TaxID=366289 RepID=A0A239GUT2_9PSED|nr:LysE family translocator [Pseudomonas delhiensis]SDK79240.1 Threonine/homoserine/homoserine lactone efflux protein [Pseudomonas delhiensis]SNS72273.1 Threonine/homoserine/homoserine lactone efflux protein [Pseudomonas delhiensis]
MFAAFALVASTHFAALLSPGPDFFLLIRAALLRGRRHADGCASGIALANLASMGLVLLVLGQLPDLANHGLRAVQLLGGAYFVWLGAQAVLVRRELEMPGESAGQGTGGFFRGLREGFLASSLNPKLPIFYTGLFGVLGPFHLPAWALGACVLWMGAVVLLWDLALVRLLDRRRWRGWLQRRVRTLDRACGALLLALGGWLLWLGVR